MRVCSSFPVHKINVCNSVNTPHTMVHTENYLTAILLENKMADILEGPQGWEKIRETMEK